VNCSYRTVLLLLLSYIFWIQDWIEIFRTRLDWLSSVSVNPISNKIFTAKFYLYAIFTLSQSRRWIPLFPVGCFYLSSSGSDKRKDLSADSCRRRSSRIQTCKGAVIVGFATSCGQARFIAHELQQLDCQPGYARGGWYRWMGHNG
jgi:hypothetical protein